MKKIFFAFTLFLSAMNLTHAQWNTLTSGTNEFLPSLSFPSVDTGYCISETGVIRKTVNAGTNWNTLTTLYSFRIHFNDNLTGFAYGGNEIFKTINGGTNWISKLTIDPAKAIDALYFINATTGYATSGDFTDSLLIFKTTDGGENWNLHSFDLVNVAYVNSLFFIDANTGFIGNWDGQILKTTDGGLNWNTVHFTTSGGMLNEIIFTSANNGFAISDMEFLKTVDGGNNWTESTPPFSALYAGMAITPDGTIHVTGGNGINSGTLIKSINNGTNWTQTGTSVQSYYDVCFVNDSIGFTCGTNGSILRFGSSTMNIHESENDFLTVYPNPVNSILRIENKSSNEIQSVRIFNSIGEQVLSTSKLNSEIDFSRFENGIYFLEVMTSQGIFREKIIKN